jgi:hypothetical protein
MPVFELAGLMERAEHLLWVIARSDVEDLSEQRPRALQRLHEVESRASELGVSNLYQEIFQNRPRYD